MSLIFYWSHCGGVEYGAQKETREKRVSFCVGATGFEPAAAWSQTRSATGLRYTPKGCKVISELRVQR